MRSEVLSLKWAQLDRKAQTIRLEPGTTKSAQARTLPYDLLPELVDVIERQRTENKRLRVEGALCPYGRGHGSRTSARRGRRHARPQAVPGRIPHDLRRTAVRNLVRAGVPEKTVMEITGHETRSVFDRYNIVNKADLRTGLGKLANEKGTTKGQSGVSGRVAQIR